MNPSPSPNHKNFLNDWLQGAPDTRHVTFTCTLLSEIGGSRPLIQRALGEAVFANHNDPDAYRAKLAHLGYPATGEARWSVTERANHVADIAEVLFRLTEIAPTVTVPDCWRRVVMLWLDGRTPPGILADVEVVAAGMSAHDLGRWIDDVFAYRLPWGLNSIGTYLKQYAEAGGQPWPAACEYYSSFVKYGVNQPIVCWLLALGAPSRAGAARIGGMIGTRVGEPESLIPWLSTGGIDELVLEGMTTDDAEMLRAAVLRDATRLGDDGTSFVIITIPQEELVGAAPELGTRILVEPAPNGERDRYRLLNLLGAVIHEFDLSSDLLIRLMTSPEFVIGEVVAPDDLAFSDQLHVRIESI